jgi:predicted TIM-barrel fold metal-dependent hydrolase
MMIIDFHTHIFPPEVRDKREDFFDREPGFRLLYSVPGSRLCRAEELIRNMDDEEIDKSVVFGFPWNTEDYFKRNNDYVLDTVERYKGRLIGFGTACPVAHGADEELQRCLRSGLSGIGELALYTETLSVDSVKGFEPIAEMAQRFDVPILFHTNEPLGHSYPGKTSLTLREIYDFLQYFPDNRIILAHWGGGLFFYHLMKRDVKGVLQNTWFDTAASPFLYDKEIYSIAANMVGSEKILFGSDFPLLKPGRYFKEMREAGLSHYAIRKICGENAASLFDLLSPAPFGRSSPQSSLR